MGASAKVPVEGRGRYNSVIIIINELLFSTLFSDRLILDYTLSKTLLEIVRHTRLVAIQCHYVYTIHFAHTFITSPLTNLLQTMEEIGHQFCRFYKQGLPPSTSV